MNSMANEVTEIKATLKYLRMPHRKVRFVADLLKNLPVDVAEAKLTVNPRRSKEPLLKLLRSAVSNAATNHHLDTKKLFVKTITVDNGPMFKRWITRSRGGVDPIQKKTSHVTMVLGVSDHPIGGTFTFVRTKKSKKETKPEKEEKQTKQPKQEPVIKEMKEIDTPKPAAETGALKKVFRRKAI